MKPSQVVVVGAGMVGLSVAWYLQEQGVEVVVLERDEPGRAASWGNAGWVAPALTMPLPDPAILGSGIRAALSPDSPVYIPPTISPKTIRFLAGFARHCTTSKWRTAMDTYAVLNRSAIESFESLGVHGGLKSASPLLAAFRDDTDREPLLKELQHALDAGADLKYEELDESEVRAIEPALGTDVRSGLRLDGQRFIDPRTYVPELARSVQARGGTVKSASEVVEVVSYSGTQCRVTIRTGEVVESTAVVLATGTWLGRLARPFGVKAVVQAGRGYSFTVQPESMPQQPIYFPTQRVACTPIEGGFRVAGMMEFRRPEDALDPKRVGAIVSAAKPMLTGVDWSARTDEWVGSRPCTSDGLPLVGQTNTSNVYVCGGHGMWGIALGPLSGQLLAQQIATGTAPAVLDALRPTR